MSQSFLPQTFAERKEAFLQKYKSVNGHIKYKRYVGSPLRYAGGKSLAVGLIVELLPDDIKRLVSPFMGGGSVEVAVSKELGLPVVGYDIFDLLMNYWDIQLHNPKELCERLRGFKPTREEFRRIKAVLKQHWLGQKRITDKYDLAALYYFNHNTSYGPHFLGWPSNVYLQKDRYEKTVEKVCNFRDKNMEVDCASFETIMDKYKNDFLYCDPPYYLGKGSTTFVGMYPHRNFPIHHINFQHELLRDFLLEHRGGFILSYNDCKQVRDWYKDFEMVAPKWQYTFGQGDTRLGENRLKNNGGSYIKKSHELIIWKMPAKGEASQLKESVVSLLKKLA